MKTWNRGFALSCFAFIAALARPGVTAAEQAVSLAGEWRFEIGGTDVKGFARDLPGGPLDLARHA
jgi:hypothetical protein